METGLHGGAQGLQALDLPDIGFGKGRAFLFHICHGLRLVFAIEPPQGFIVQHRVGLVRTDIAEAEAGGLDGHQAVLQLYGCIAAAALDIISPAAGGLGHSGKGCQMFAIFFKKHHINSL